MANVYAVKTGNWSDTTVWNTAALPTSADDVYSNNFTVTIDQNVTVLSIRNTSATGITAGGGFTSGSGRTMSFTGSGLIQGSTSTSLLTFTHSSGTSTVNGNILLSFDTVNFIPTLHVSGTGTVGFVGNISNTSIIRNKGIRISGGGIVNMIGNISVTWSGNVGVELLNSSTLNLTGNIVLETTGGANTVQPLNITNSIVNVTGNITMRNNITGGGMSANSNSIILNTGATLNVTGIITAENTSAVTTARVISALNANLYLSVVGALIANFHSLIENLNTTSINIFSGPFVCGSTGIIPFLCARMHYKITSGSYFEFRDSSTNGALPPSTPAPATRLVSPDTAVDAPAASNVRFGVTYALGTQTGTLRVPSPNSVAFGVLTDNTTGTAVLTPQAVWDYATSSLTTAGSIGERLKNASTVDTTGDQLAALL